MNKIKKLSNIPASLWRKYLFNTKNKHILECDGFAALNDVALLRAASEDEFKKLFFEQMHLFKARYLLSDYYDLNRRYFKTTDAVIFTDGILELDVLPRCWLYPSVDDLLNIAFTLADNLAINVELNEIAPFLAINEQRLYENLETLYGVAVTTATDANRIINEERYRRFNALIDERFNRISLVDLLDKFEKRDDEAIRRAVTNNANIPTIFEYVLGIAWYLVSNRRISNTHPLTRSDAYRKYKPTETGNGIRQSASWRIYYRKR